MTGIVFATEEEALPFLQHYERGRFDGLTEGESAQDERAVVTITGIGKIKATLRTERFLRQHQVKRVLHVGTCTVLNEKAKVGDLVAAAQVFEGDRIELSAPTYPRMPLEVPYRKLPSGVLVTQDHVVQDQTEQSYWQRIADFSDMAGYAIAYVAATYGLPCHMVKVVTARMGMQDTDFRRTLTTGHERLAEFLIRELTKPPKKS